MDARKEKPREGMTAGQAAERINLMSKRLIESSKAERPADFSRINDFMRGITDVSQGLVAGNRGLTVASEKDVLLSYDVGGLNPHARIGAYVTLKASEKFGMKDASEMLDSAVKAVQGKGIMALIRGNIQTDISSEVPGYLQVRIMDACDIEARGIPYVTSPSKVARKALLAADVRDDFIGRASSSGVDIVREEGSLFD
ncbi:MAG: hypothetical protein KGH94_03995 [Candidatus Micrarchaeota archaeon]|nr:hypothetical protein [Candidatus Micrarchaeota archaeon]